MMEEGRSTASTRGLPCESSSVSEELASLSAFCILSCFGVSSGSVLTVFVIGRRVGGWRAEWC